MGTAGAALLSLLLALGDAIIVALLRAARRARLDLGGLGGTRAAATLLGRENLLGLAVSLRVGRGRLRGAGAASVASGA